LQGHAIVGDKVSGAIPGTARIVRAPSATPLTGGRGCPQRETRQRVPRSQGNDNQMALAPADVIPSRQEGP